MLRAAESVTTYFVKSCLWHCIVWAMCFVGVLASPSRKWLGNLSEQFQKPNRWSLMFGLSIMTAYYYQYHLVLLSDLEATRNFTWTSFISSRVCFSGLNLWQKILSALGSCPALESIRPTLPLCFPTKWPNVCNLIWQVDRVVYIFICGLNRFCM